MNSNADVDKKPAVGGVYYKADDVSGSSTVTSAGLENGAPVIATTGRQGHLFCGYCCDMRRAVAILNILTITWALLGFILFKFPLFESSVAAADVDDDKTSYAADNKNKESFDFFFILSPAIVLPAFGLWAAIRFKKYMICLLAFWYTFDFLLCLIIFDYVGATVSGIATYAHVVFYSQLDHGIMTVDTYHANERHSCCCV
jgi:hypothetical protein